MPSSAMMLAVGIVPVLLLAAWLASALLLDRYGRRATAAGTWDALVVLGCRVREDGSPSGHLARRVERAVSLWEQGRAPIVVLSGGGEPSEASVAARYARGLGLPASATVVEDEARSTGENARFCARRLRAERVLVVTDSYHVLRARWEFERCFPEVLAVGVVAPPRARVENSLREVLALSWYLLRRALGHG